MPTLKNGYDRLCNVVWLRLHLRIPDEFWETFLNNLNSEAENGKLDEYINTLDELDIAGLNKYFENLEKKGGNSKKKTKKYKHSKKIHTRRKNKNKK